ncbi:hypothetical protein KKE26_03650 [bacterium]|nr:hypothetical protein [bacterium]MBU1753598.1 hypothetical protein [bacterium]
MAVSTEELADSMYALVAEYAGKKKLKASDIVKEMIDKYGDEVDKNQGKEAIRLLMDSERCVYTYFGGTYIELPHKEGSAPE